MEEMRRLIKAGAEIDETDGVSEGGGSVSVGRGGWLWQSFVGRAWREGGGVRFEGGRSGCAGFVRLEEESVQIVHNWDDQLIRRLRGGGLLAALLGFRVS